MFFRLKLHFILNTSSKILRLQITSSDIDNRLPIISLMQDISTKLICDKGYISQKLQTELFNQNFTFINKIKKKCLMDMTDKMMLINISFTETTFFVYQEIENANTP